MKEEFKVWATLNVLAIMMWGLVGGVYGAYEAFAEMNIVAMVVACWLLLVMVLILVGATEYYAFLSLVRFLKALYRWLEMRNFGS